MFSQYKLLSLNVSRQIYKDDINLLLSVDSSYNLKFCKKCLTFEFPLSGGSQRLNKALVK